MNSSFQPKGYAAFLIYTLFDGTSNGTLLDDSWCDLFKRHGVRVGVSVDGPAFIHDHHRQTRSGKGTHALVLRGLATLRRNNVSHHVVAVVTAKGVDHADAIHAFFVDQEIHEVGFNFDEAEGLHRASSLLDREEGHRAFIERMLDHMIASGGGYQVRELVNALRLIAADSPTYRWRGNPLPENGQTLPFALVSVAWNGDFSTFSPELLGQPNPTFRNFVLGNVAGSGYLAATLGEPFRSLWAGVRRGVSACQMSCAYFNYCGGGAPANKLYENGSIESAETLYCRTMIQRPFDVALSRLEAALFASGEQNDRPPMDVPNNLLQDLNWGLHQPTKTGA